MHASHEVSDERKALQLVIGGAKSGKAKGRVLDIRALVNVLEQDCDYCHEIHRFSGVLLGGAKEVLLEESRAASSDDAM